MSDVSLVEPDGHSVDPATLGAVAALAGAGAILFYPLSMAGVLPGTEQYPSGAPHTSHPVLVYVSVIVGSLLLTWGGFAYLDEDYTPLTPRRALSALGPAFASTCVAVSWFVYEWIVRPPTNIEGETPSITLVQTLRLELTAVQFIALAAVSAAFVGTVAATRDRWSAVAATAVPFGLVGTGLRWGPQQLTLLSLLIIAVIVAIPGVVGYVAARPDGGPRTV